jgi:hypothetical protein
MHIKKQSVGNLVTGQSTINLPAKTLFVKGLQVYDSTSLSTGSNQWLEKKDESYLQEYIPAETSTGMPKYYAMFGGATGVTDITSGRLYLAPVPDSTYVFKIHYEAIPDGLSSANTTTYISQYFGNGLLYACLVEAYGYLKGPMDMLTLYENKYKEEVSEVSLLSNWVDVKEMTTQMVRLGFLFRLHHLNRRLNYGNIISNMFKF